MLFIRKMKPTQGAAVPRGFLHNGAEPKTAEEFNQKKLEYVADAAHFDEGEIAASFPAGDGAAIVSGDGFYLFDGQHIGLLGKQRRIECPHLCMDFRGKCGFPDLIAFVVPMFGYGVEFGEQLSLFHILHHIRFADLVAAGLLAAVLAGDFSRPKKIHRRALGNVAELIKLFFCECVRNGVPVDRSCHNLHLVSVRIRRYARPKRCIFAAQRLPKLPKSCPNSKNFAVFVGSNQ